MDLAPGWNTTVPHSPQESWPDHNLTTNPHSHAMILDAESLQPVYTNARALDADPLQVMYQVNVIVYYAKYIIHNP